MPFANSFRQGVIFLLSSVLLCASIYVCMAHSSFRDAERHANTKMLEAWWRFARFPVGFCLWQAIVGIFSSAMTFGALLQLMAPKHELLNGEPWSWLHESYHERNSYDFAYMYDWYGFRWAVCPVFFAFLVLSFALYQKTKVYLELKSARRGAAAAPSNARAPGRVVKVQPAGDGARSVEALVDAVADGKGGVTAAQRRDAAEMLAGLGLATEAELAAVVAHVDWARHLPGFPVRVELELKRHFSTA